MILLQKTVSGRQLLMNVFYYLEFALNRRNYPFIKCKTNVGLNRKQNWLDEYIQTQALWLMKEFKNLIQVVPKCWKHLVLGEAR